MNPKQSLRAGTFGRALLRWPGRLLALGLVIFSIQAANAQTVYWDPAGLHSSGGSGSGNWDLTTADWWSAGSSDVTWSQTSTTAGTTNAIFGGVDGTYTITLGGTQIAASSLTFNNSGYTLSSGTLYNGGALTVAANKTATINSAITGPNSQQTYTVNSGATLNLGGNVSTLQLKLTGGGTINMTGGTWSVDQFWGLNTTFNQNGGIMGFVGSGTFYLGYSGSSYYTVNNGATINENSTDIVLCRSGNTASLTLKSGSTVNIGTGGTARNLTVCNDGSVEHATVDVQGGTLTEGSSTSAGLIRMMVGGGGNGETAVFTVEGGVVNAWGGFQFGAASGTYTATCTSTLTLSSGSLYVGAGGIVEGTAHATTDAVNFMGGTVGTLANWSMAMPINLGSSGGPVTFQAASASGVSNNITLSGALTNSQGFIKTGAGILTLGGTNTYKGATVINAGTVALGANASISNSASINLAAGATLDVSAIAAFAANTNNNFTAAGTGTTVGSTAANIVGNAAGTVDLGTNNITLTYDGTDPALYVSSGALKVEGNLWTINGATLAVGTYTIAQVANGIINSNGPPTCNGTAIAQSYASIQFNGGLVQLVVTGVRTPVTVLGLTANNKIYDGTTVATINLTGYTLSGVLPGDVGNVYLVTNGYTANFTDANAGLGKSVTVSGLSLGGSAAGNYYLVPATGFTANITNATSTMVLTCANTNVYAGWPYAFVASLSIVSGGVPTNGTVTFTTNNVPLGTGTANVNASGIASILAYLAPGSYTVTAGYPSTANVVGCSNTITVVVGTSSSSGLVWDANTAALGAQDGSGTWNGSNTNWWNGSNNVVWASGDAVFGGGVDGAYTVANSGVTATSLTFNNSGYTIAGSSIGANSAITVAANKTATVQSALTGGNSGVTYTANAGATLNLSGNISTMQINLQGAGTFNLSGVNTPNIFNLKSTVNQTAGSMTPVVYSFVGYNVSGAYTITNSSLTMNGGGLTVARNGYTGSLIIQNGATVGFAQSGSTACNLSFTGEASGNDHGTLDVQGGTLTLGTSSALAANCELNLMTSGGSTNETAIMTQEGGAITAWGGILLGGTGTYSGNCTNSYTMTGGSLYLASSGLYWGANHPSSSTVTLSGGTVGALQDWTTPIPITLGTSNGNVTVECDDGSGNPHNITLNSGAVGSGGMIKTGSGTLTLSGAINYGGATVVSNGTLVIQPTGNSVSSGAVTLDNTAGGNPALTVTENAGQYWSVGPLTLNSTAYPTLTFNLGSLVPSTTVAPIQVVGNVNFTATPNVTVTGTAIPNGIFPLIQYTGTTNGVMPTSLTLPGYISGGASYITNITATKTIAMVVIGSLVNPALSWAVGSGAWDFGSYDWKQVGNPIQYTDGSSVIFDDTASGMLAITVTNNTMVFPFSVTANNSTNKSYTIMGTGSIAGAATLSVLGSGTFTLAGTNSYSGGTTVSAGQLNLNNGGDSSGANSAIGTGPLTLAAGVALDNTSGSDVTLMPSPPITESWNGSFTYLGSSNSLNMGAGNVSMNDTMTLTVISHTFTVGGTITDNNESKKLIKAGNGTLTMGTANIEGGFTLLAGQLNLGLNGSVGTGTLEIDGGAIDNVSGSDLTVNPGNMNWYGSFTYVGSSNNLDLGSAPVAIGPITLTVVSNTLTTEGVLASGNSVFIKNGNGTFNIIGASANGNSSLVVNGGQVNLGKSSGYAISISGSSSPGLTVNSNALVVITGTSGDQIRDGIGGNPNPVKLNSGALDLNGHNETVDSLLITNSGTLRNSANYSTLTVGPVGGNTLTISGTNCAFDVPGAELDIAAIVAGNGSLLKTGAGLLVLKDNTTYTGNTIINSGELEINNASLAGTSTVSIATNAMLYLNFAATNTVGSLVIGGTNYLPGVYNATTDPAYFDANSAGSLMVPASGPAIFTNTPGITGFGIATNGTDVVLTGTNGQAGCAYYLLTSTNLSLPIYQWTAVATDVLSAAGPFTFIGTNAVTPGDPHQFFILSNTNY